MRGVPASDDTQQLSDLQICSLPAYCCLGFSRFQSLTWMPTMTSQMLGFQKRTDVARIKIPQFFFFLTQTHKTKCETKTNSVWNFPTVSTWWTSYIISRYIMMFLPINCEGFWGEKYMWCPTLLAFSFCWNSRCSSSSAICSCWQSVSYLSKRESAPTPFQTRHWLSFKSTNSERRRGLT